MDEWVYRVKEEKEEAMELYRKLLAWAKRNRRTVTGQFYKAVFASKEVAHIASEREIRGLAEIIPSKVSVTIFRDLDSVYLK